jgi:hypothetical protein
MRNTPATPSLVEKLSWGPSFSGLVVIEWHLGVTFGLALPPRPQNISPVSLEGQPRFPYPTPRKMQSPICTVPPFPADPITHANGCSLATPRHATPQSITAPLSTLGAIYGSPLQPWSFNPSVYPSTPVPVPTVICHLVEALQVTHNPPGHAEAPGRRPRPHFARARVCECVCVCVCVCVSARARASAGGGRGARLGGQGRATGAGGEGHRGQPPHGLHGGGRRGAGVRPESPGPIHTHRAAAA